MAESSTVHRLAVMLKALAEETRLQMVLLLAEWGELCVCDLEHALDITQSKASRHLRYLLNSGIVNDSRRGVWMHYRLAEDLDPCVAQIIACLRGAVPVEELAKARERLSAWLATEGKDVPGCRSCGADEEG